MLTSLVLPIALLQSGNTLAQPIEAPFKVTEYAIIVDAVVNGKNASFMFDTGYGGTIVISDQIDIGKPTGTVTLRDFVRELSAPTVPLKSLQIGALKLSDLQDDAVLQPRAASTETYGTHCDGIMGLSAVIDYVTEINIEKSKFVFHPKSVDITKRIPDNVKTFLVKLEPHGFNSIELLTLVNGKPLHLALDTGNSFYVTTHKEVLERVGVWDKNQKPKYMTQAFVASGAVDSFPIWIKDAIIYGVPVKASIWDIIDLPSSSVEHDGTVGFQFLKNFNITIDFERRHVWLENFTGKNADIENAEPGIAIYRNDAGRIQIWRVFEGSPAAAAGVKDGDILMAVNGKSLSMVAGRDIQSLLHGPPGSKVRLTVSRDGSMSHYEVERRVLANGTPP
jgi:predicted aspartyl protease